MNAAVCCCGWICGVDVSKWHDAGEGSPQGLPGRGEVDVMGPPMVVTYRLQVIPLSYCVSLCNILCVPVLSQAAPKARLQAPVSRIPACVGAELSKTQLLGDD